MKWSVIGLVFLGLIAAACATFLVASVRANGTMPGSGGVDRDEIEVLVAAKTLEAMTAVTSDAFVVETISKNVAPEGALTSPVQLTGQILSVPMTEGQLFTSSCLVAEGSRPQFAAMLPNGMRAVSVSLSDYSGMEGLLYPGCLVDVLVAFDLPTSRQSKGEAVSTTLLHGIQVLAVEHQTIVSGEDGEKKDRGGVSSRSSNRRRVVTVMVTPRQAEALQLAMEHGAISLSMRNPLDKDPVDVDATLLNEGKLAQLAALLDAAVAGKPAAGEGAQAEPASLASLIEGQGDIAAVEGPLALPSTVQSAGATGNVGSGTVVSGASLAQQSATWTPETPQPKRAYEVTVIKGSKLEVQEFDQGAGEEAPAGQS